MFMTHGDVLQHAVPDAVSAMAVLHPQLNGNPAALPIAQNDQAVSGQLLGTPFGFQLPQPNFVDVVGVHAGHHLQARREVQKLLRHDHVWRQDDAPRLVAGIAQCDRIIGQLGLVAHLTPLLQPQQGVRHQWFDQQDIHSRSLVGNPGGDQALSGV